MITKQNRHWSQQLILPLSTTLSLATPLDLSPRSSQPWLSPCFSSRHPTHPPQFILWAATQRDNLFHRQFQLNYLKLFKSFLWLRQKSNHFIMIENAFHGLVLACQISFAPASLSHVLAAQPCWTIISCYSLSAPRCIVHTSLSMEHSSQIFPPSSLPLFKTQVFSPLELILFFW